MAAPTRDLRRGTEEKGVSGVLDQSRIGDFIAASPYSDAVDIKKLGFVLSTLDRYAAGRRMELNELHVLEIACGRGGITLPLASLGCHVTAFDIDEEAVRYVQTQRGQRGVENLSVTVGNGYTFDDGNSYDIVIASEVFEHVADPPRLARNIAKRMAEGSYLIVTTPNGYGPYELVNRIDVRTYLRRWSRLRRLLGKPPFTPQEGAGHCQFYTRARLVELFSRFSAELIDSASSDSFLTVFPSLRRNALLGRLDIRLADMLPYWLASGWYFVFQLQGSPRPTPN